MLSTRMFHVKSSDSITPSGFACLTTSTGIPSMIIFGTDFLKLTSCIKLIIISFDFLELIFIQFIDVQSAALSIDSWVSDSSFVLHISKNVLSYTYLNEGTCVSKSFIYNKKHFGPDRVPCGTPPFGLPVREYILPIFTCCCLYMRKADNHLTIYVLVNR